MTEPNPDVQNSISGEAIPLSVGINAGQTIRVEHVPGFVRLHTERPITTLTPNEAAQVAGALLEQAQNAVHADRIARRTQ